MSILTPSGLETITYGQQGWNAIITANMQKLNGWISKLFPLVDSTTRTAGAVPVWDQVTGNWKPSAVVQNQETEIVALRAALEALQVRVAALEG